MDILLNFGENLSTLIFDKNIPVEDFANAVKIEVSVVYRYLRKESLPSLNNLVIIADYFKCSTDYLLGIASNSLQTNLNRQNLFPKDFLNC